MITATTGPNLNLLPLRPLSAGEIANQKGGEESSRKRTAPADAVRGLGPGVPRSLLDLSTLAGLDRQVAAEDDGEAKLSDEQQREIDALKRADTEIRRHEAAHSNAGGRYTGAASFEYQVGPDGKRYAVAGEVPIDVSPVAGDPQATIAKMQVVKRAASAPTTPSGQDRSVAATAAKVEAEARAELQAERTEAVSGDDAAATPGAEDGTATPANRLSEFVAARYAATATIAGEAGAPVSAADTSSTVATPRFVLFA